MNVLANLVIDHQTASRLRSKVTPPVLFYVALMECGHWQTQRAESSMFAHEGEQLPCLRCDVREAVARELVGVGHAHD